MSFKYLDLGSSHKRAPFIIPHFICPGLSVLEGSQSSGKTSLMLKLAVAESQGVELWPDGPIGQGRASFFVSGGIIKESSIIEKARLLGAQKDKIFITKPCRYPIGALSQLGFKRPACIFFDLIDSGVLRRLRRFKQLIRGGTAFIGLLSRPLSKKQTDSIKSIPVLKIIKRGHYSFLLKKRGFLNPRGALKFQPSITGIESLAFIDKDLSSLNRSQDDLLRDLLEKQSRQSDQLPAAQIRELAKREGISSYFLRRVQWPDYGLQTKGQGFAGDYRQVLVPLKKH